MSVTKNLYYPHVTVDNGIVVDIIRSSFCLTFLPLPTLPLVDTSCCVSENMIMLKTRFRAASNYLLCAYPLSISFAVIFLINHSVYKMSHSLQVLVRCQSKVYMFKCLVCLTNNSKPRKIQFTFITDQENWTIFTFQKLEPVILKAFVLLTVNSILRQN